MKKKLIIILPILLFFVCVGVTGGWIHEKRQQETEQRMKRFEKQVQERYGTRNYLGPMMEEVEPLTKEDIESLNSDGKFTVEGWESSPDVIAVRGRCNKERIEDIYDAREVAYSVAAYFKRPYDAYSFIYGTRREEKPYDTYRFEQYYKGIRVGGLIDVVVDKDGYTYQVWINSTPQEDITIDSIEVQFTKEDMISYLDEKYMEYELTECVLRLERFWEEREGKDLAIWKLVWDIAIFLKDSDGYYMTFDAQTGEVLDIVVGEEDY